MGYKRTRAELGPNPDPDIWEDVRTKDGWFRRKKRKNMKLNAVMQEHADSLKVTMPAAKRILEKLEPWVRGLELGRVQAAISTLLKKSYFEDEKMGLRYLQDLELQPRRPFKALVGKTPYVEVSDEVFVKILIPSDGLKVKNSIYTEYYFELILLWGDVTKGGKLKVDSVESQLYERPQVSQRKTDRAGEYCELRINLPSRKQPWIALFKVGCLEGKQLAYHPRHYGMKVVAVGN